MKAKCPRCSDGCYECDNGYIEVTFPDEDMWIVTCDDCSMEIGGGFLPPEKAKYLMPSNCPFCGSKNYKWECVD